jgi:hypothetical protein
VLEEADRQEMRGTGESFVERRRERHWISVYELGTRKAAEEEGTKLVGNLAGERHRIPSALIGIRQGHLPQWVFGDKGKRISFLSKAEFVFVRTVRPQMTVGMG